MDKNISQDLLTTLLSKETAVKKYIAQASKENYRHVSWNGLILTPFVATYNSIDRKQEGLVAFRIFLQNNSHYFLHSSSSIATLLRDLTVSFGGSCDVLGIYNTYLNSTSINKSVEFGRMDYLDDKATEVNFNCIDSLIDYKDLETIVSGLWNELGIVLPHNYRLQKSFIDVVLDKLAQQALIDNKHVIGWLSSRVEIKKHWPRDIRFLEYAQSYLDFKYKDIEISLVCIENLTPEVLDKFSVLYNCLYPTDLATVTDTRILSSFVRLCAENRLFSPYFTNIFENKSIQAILFSDETLKEEGLNTSGVDTIRKYFPETLLLCDLLNSLSIDEINKTYGEWYVKHSFSWCGDKVYKMKNIKTKELEFISNDIAKNKLSWVIQKPISHLETHHLQYNLLDNSLGAVSCVCDSGLQFMLDVSKNEVVTTVSSRNTINVVDSVISRSDDNTFRPAITLVCD